MKTKMLTVIGAIGFLFVSSIAAFAAQATYTPVMGDYCIQPPFLSSYVPPQVLFTLSKDHKMYSAAYNDDSDINEDGRIETTYLHSFNYYGYFDSNKCYSYASGVFKPYGVTSDKYCSSSNCTDKNGSSIDCSNKFSGNFLNWATMSRADVVKMVIYGGYRTADNIGDKYAQISGEWVPQDGHIWGKEYVGADAAKLFPGGAANKRALFCVNGAVSGGKYISQLKVLPDVTAVSGVTVSGGLRAWHWINVDGNSDICGDSRIDLDGNGSASNATLTNRSNYNVTVQVCDPDLGFNDIGDWERKHCKLYGVNYRPVGLMQIYGETANSAQICSKDMATPCTNDNGCTGNGQCLNASNMFFGLIAGSYQNPKAGGYIRKDIYSINEETVQTTGKLQTSASSGKGLLIKSIEELKCPTTYPLNTHVGNPMGEILYEGLRYWGGKGEATAAFIENIGTNDSGYYASKPPWDTPATLYPSCSIPFNLVFSDIYNSFDHDQVPGSAFVDVSGDLAGFDANALANTIWANENLGTPLVIGESGTTSGNNTDGRCGGKSVTGLGSVKGICPSEGNQSGSYYAASAALYGHNLMKTKNNTPNILTYVVAFNSNTPELRVFTDSGKSVLVSPYGKSVSSSFGWSCSITNTTFAVANVVTSGGTTTKSLTFTPKDSTSNCPTLAQVSFYVLETEYDVSNKLKYIKFRVATDDLGGGDFDLDMLTEYTVCAHGATNTACSGLTTDQVSVKTERVYSSAGNPAGLGFTIAGVGGTDSGTYMTVQHTSSPPGGSGWAGNQLPTTSATMKFVAAGSATLPKPPLWYAAKYGGFRDIDNDGLPYTDSTCSQAITSPTRSSKCNEWSSKIPGVPDTYFEISNPSQMEQRLRDALDAILSRVASGTAASILNNSEGSGASLLQAVFFPKKDFDDNTSTNWIGELHNMWYYLDPYLNSTSIREDTNTNDATDAYKLTLTKDRIARFDFDKAQNKTVVNLFNDTDGNGSADTETPVATVDPDDVKSLWKAGRKLWARSTARTLYTHTDLSTTGFDDTTTKLTLFTNNDNLKNSTAFRTMLQAADATETGKLIDYTHGIDQTGYRSRMVQINACNTVGSGCQTSDSVYKRAWKLGDIVSSTPKLVSSVALNSFHNDSPNGYEDTSYKNFITSSTYKSRGMAFVGANDGMLHAFRLGVLSEINEKNTKAQFNDSSTGNLADASSDLGKEEWAFIPKQVLPYLTYLKDTNYCHLFTVDKSPSVVDVSIVKPASCTAANYWDCPKDATAGTNWGTVLIGGMGFGGAAKWNGSSGDTAPADDVKTPIKGAAYTDGVGYSSYFALDVTDPTAPKYKWEFPGTTSAAGQLGFSTTGPAIIRIAKHTDTLDSGGKRTRAVDNTKNGRWFAVFASGPTGPIENIKRDFKGQSDQQLRIFVVDLADGTLVRTIEKFADNTTLPAEAFAGTLTTSWIDTDRATKSSVGWYSDDAVYISYTYKHTDGTWSKGGILRLSTEENTDPANWKVSKLIDGIGPVTTSVTKLQDRRNSNLWIYFGTGRYFFKGDDTTNTQTLYGVKDPCYASTTLAATATQLEVRKNAINPYCTTSVSGTLVDQSGSASTAPSATISSSAPGWKVTLDSSATGYGAERVITDPLASTAGAVFFTTFKPSNDVCAFGGDTLIWALRYDTGGVPPARSMMGKALLQVSTGAFKELSLADAFKNAGNQRLDGRRIKDPITGVPPTSQGLSLIVNPPPIKKLLHVREK